MLISTQIREGIRTLLAQASHLVRALREGGPTAPRQDGFPSRLGLAQGLLALRALDRRELVHRFEAVQVVDADEGGDGLPMAFDHEALPGIMHPSQEIPGALA